MTDENIATLVDSDHYYLNAKYQSWITDPTDPATKQAAKMRKRQGHKPPPVPVIFPVAKRPALVTKVLEQAALKAAKPTKPKNQGRAGEVAPREFFALNLF